jgi:hypothetical protein
MATTSNSGSGHKQSTSSSSRFASLKVFKFATVSSRNSPPIPPPKEKPPTNVSLVSLTTEPYTPRTPVTPDYSRSQSTPPCPAKHSPALSSQDHISSSSSTASSFGKGLMKFAKRSLTPKSVSRQLSESSEDGSISLPWNFQVCPISDRQLFSAAYMPSPLSISPSFSPVQVPVVWVLIVNALVFAPLTHLNLAS